MPEEPIWLGVLTKVVAFLIIGVAWFFSAELFIVWMGHLGAWAERLLTLGRRRPDPDSWFSIILGWLITLIVIMVLTEVFILHKLGGN